VKEFSQIDRKEKSGERLFSVNRRPNFRYLGFGIADLGFLFDYCFLPFGL
jgi:hypothetical protein